MIFFDIDGTLLDHALAERKAIENLWSRYDFFQRIPREEFVALWAHETEIAYNRHLKKKLTFEEQRRVRVQAVGRSVGESLGEAEADGMFSLFLRAYEDNWSLFPDVRPLLNELTKAGNRLGVITNGDGSQQRDKLRRTNIERFFDPIAIVISGEQKIAKPDPGIFHLACTRAGMNPQECWYIGDRLDVDAKASRAAGMNAIWLDREKGQVAAGEGILTFSDLRTPALWQTLGLAPSRQPGIVIPS